MLAARKIFGRSGSIPLAAYAMPALLWNSLDWLNPWPAPDMAATHESDAAYQTMQPHHDLYPGP